MPFVLPVVVVGNIIPGVNVLKFEKALTPGYFLKEKIGYQICSGKKKSNFRFSYKNFSEV